MRSGRSRGWRTEVHKGGVEGRLVKRRWRLKQGRLRSLWSRKGAVGCNGISGRLGARWTLQLGFHSVDKRYGFLFILPKHASLWLYEVRGTNN